MISERFTSAAASVRISHHLPSQCLTFLGVVFNSVSMTLSISEDKMKECFGILQFFIVQRKVNKRAIQSLVGKLNWLSQIIYGGCNHLRRLIDKCNRLRKPWHRTLVTQDMKKDILWWINFMHVFNGTMDIVDHGQATSVLIDSCKVAGGAFYQGDFIYAPLTETTAVLPINYLEVLSLELAAFKWAHLWANKKVTVHCDNVTACTIINKFTCRNPTVMHSLRCVFWLSALYNFRLKAFYYSGPQNTLADRVSMT